MCEICKKYTKNEIFSIVQSSIKLSCEKKINSMKLYLLEIYALKHTPLSGVSKLKIDNQAAIYTHL